MSGSTPDAVVKLGQPGHVARDGHRRHRDRCLDAAVTYDAAKAKGSGGALRPFAQPPSGTLLLILVTRALTASRDLVICRGEVAPHPGGVPA
jgi:hypothetical protein